MATKIIAYLSIYIVWSTTYLAIKWGVDSLPPVYVVGLRFALGGPILLAIALVRKSPFGSITWRSIAASVGVGILLLLGGNGLVTIAVTTVDSYLAALIVAVTPIAVLLYDKVLFKKKVGWHAWGGVALGIVGVGVLLMNGTGAVPQISPQAGLVLCAVALWGLGTSLSKHVGVPKDPFVNSGIQCTVVGVVVLALAQLYIPATTFAWSGVSALSWIGVGFLALFGSLALGAYAWLLKHEPNHRIVSYALVNPPLAVVLGLLVGKETAVPYLYPGMALILAGLFMMFYVKRSRA